MKQRNKKIQNIRIDQTKHAYNGVSDIDIENG